MISTLKIMSLTAMLVVLANTTLLSHELTLTAERIDENTVEVYCGYGPVDPIEGVTIKIQTKNAADSESAIEAGTTDAKGQARINVAVTPATSIVAEDGAGHRSVIDTPSAVGEAMRSNKRDPGSLVWRIATGIAVIALASFLAWRALRESKEKAA